MHVLLFFGLNSFFLLEGATENYFIVISISKRYAHNDSRRDREGDSNLL